MAKSLKHEPKREEGLSVRTRTLYFLAKVLIVVGYAAIVLATVTLAPPSTLAKNQIGAHILVLQGDPVVGRYFVIANESRDHWKNVVFKLGEYEVRRELVRSGEKITLYVHDFKKEVMLRRRGRDIAKVVSAPVDMPLKSLAIRCSEGMAVEPLLKTQ